jgi:AraC-like DNA-binding protein
MSFRSPPRGRHVAPQKALPMFVSLLFVRLLCAELQRRQIDARPVLAASGVSESQLVDLRYALPALSLEKALSRAVELSDDPAIGLAVGARPPEETLTILAHLALAAPSLSTAMECVCEHARVLGDGVVISWNAEDEGQPTRLTVRFGAALGERSARYLGEVLVGSFATLCQRIAGAEALVSVSLPQAEPPDPARYARSYGCPVDFGAPLASLFLDHPHREPQPFADTAMFTVLSEAAERLVGSAGRQASFGDQLRSMLSREPNLCELGMARLARTMGVTQRTFRRRLSSEGLRVSDLLREARLARAREELGRNDRSIKEVAEQLGYSEPSAFHRAFRSWTGMTPAAYVRSSQATRRSTLKPPAHGRS